MRAIQQLEDNGLLQVSRGSNGQGNRYITCTETAPLSDKTCIETVPVDDKSSTKTVPLSVMPTGTETVQACTETAPQAVPKRRLIRFSKDSIKDSYIEKPILLAINSEPATQESSQGNEQPPAQLFPIQPDAPAEPTKKKSRKSSEPILADVPMSLQNIPGFLHAWAEFMADRIDRKKPMTERAQKMALNKLDVMDDPVAAIERSIEAGWSGVFERKEQPRKGGIVEYSEEWWAEQEDTYGDAFDRYAGYGKYSTAPDELKARYAAAKTSEGKKIIEREWTSSDAFKAFLATRGITHETYMAGGG